MARGPRTIVIGIGNADRGDDGVGAVVIRALCGMLPADIERVENGGEATGLVELLRGATAAFLIDASRSGAPPGTIRRFDVRATSLPQMEFGISSHGLGLAEAVELARTLDVLPRICVVYAIEGRSFALGAPLSVELAEAVTKAAERVRQEIGGLDAAET